MKNVIVELGSVSRFYSVEYERDNGDTVFAAINEMWDANTDSGSIDIVSIEIGGVDVMLKSELSQKEKQVLREEVFQVFENRR